MSGPRVMGLDAAGSAGWVGVVIDDEGVIAADAGPLAELVTAHEPLDVIGIDIPIGSHRWEPRRADAELRRLVGPRRASVFPAIPAGVLAFDDYAAANAELARRGLPRLSRQAWGLRARIIEAAERAEADPRLHEVFPEASFAELAGGPLASSKRTFNGVATRLRLLAEAGIVVPDDLPALARIPADDVLDAAAVAWSARRIARGLARPVPDPPEQVGGRALAVWI